jgi:predicted house-cleaning noncanonical NTP pyrophosphatase (MazG superfamily)
MVPFRVMRVSYAKLVRDRVPEIICSAGHRPVTRVLDKAGYQRALLAKLVEEVDEVRVSPADQLAEELADVLEVLRSLPRAHGVPWSKVLTTRADKFGKRGGFSNRIFLEYVDESDSG